MDVEAKSEYGERAWKVDEKRVIQRLLEHKLGNEHIAIRPGSSGTKFAYVESWKAIELANSIFGFDGWSSQIVDITPDFIEEIPGGKFRVGVTAVVKVMLKDGTFHEDVGYGICENKSKGIAIENSKKEAVSDARKRALRVFGNALGNCVYDKEHIKKIKAKLKPAATSTVSFDKLRVGMSQGNANGGGVTAPPPQPNEYQGNGDDNEVLPLSPDGNGEYLAYPTGEAVDYIYDTPTHENKLDHGYDQSTVPVPFTAAAGQPRQPGWQ